MHASLSPFTFGAEFEVLLPRTLGRDLAASEFTRISGLPCAAHLSTVRPGGWKVVSDGSVHGPGMHGLEFVSPILSGDEGLEQVKRAANALQAMGAKVNQTCGFHVHVGNHGGQLSFFKSLVKLYGRFESVLDELMPASRRGNGSMYCRSVALGLRAVDSCTSKEAIASALARASAALAPKYHKVNLVPLGKPTVEFRHHAGTISAEKAATWIVTCLRMVAAAKEGKTGEGALIAIDTATLALKTRAVLEMCSRSEGASHREICERFGFQTVSVKRHARLAAVSFRKSGERFYIDARVPAPSSTAVPLTLEGLTTLLGSEEGERQFLAARARAL
jgi:hypothetical protein